MIELTMQKTCKDCKIEKPEEEFYKQYNKKVKKYYYRLNCISCENERAKRYHLENRAKRSFQNRDWNLKQKFGITAQEYDLMLEQQDNACKICKSVDSDRGLAVDHDHLTGKVRGLLCGKCNRGLGHFDDSIEMLELAIKYLKS
jgi:hypothetical protein